MTEYALLNAERVASDAYLGLSSAAKILVPTMVIAGFTFTAALAFNDAAQSTVASAYPGGRETLAAKWIYAFSIVLLLVIISAVYVHETGKQLDLPTGLPMI